MFKIIFVVGIFYLTNLLSVQSDLTSSQQITKSEVRVDNGIRFTLVPHKIIYQGSVPLFFTAEWNIGFKTENKTANKTEFKEKSNKTGRTATRVDPTLSTPLRLIENPVITETGQEQQNRDQTHYDQKYEQEQRAKEQLRYDQEYREREEERQRNWKAVLAEQERNRKIVEDRKEVDRLNRERAERIQQENDQRESDRRLRIEQAGEQDRIDNQRQNSNSPGLSTNRVMIGGLEMNANSDRNRERPNFRNQGGVRRESGLYNAYYDFSHTLSNNYSIPDTFRNNIEGRASSIRIGTWKHHLKMLQITSMPIFLRGVELHWQIVTSKDWPVEFLINLWESIHHSTLPSTHPDKVNKYKPLGILRLMIEPDYSEYQALLKLFSINQIVVPKGEELPMSYIDYRAHARRFENETESPGGSGSNIENEPFLTPLNLTRTDARQHFAELRAEIKLFRQQIRDRKISNYPQNSRTDLSSDSTTNTLLDDLKSSDRNKRETTGFLRWCCDAVYRSELEEFNVDKARIESYMEVVKQSLTGEQQEIVKITKGLEDADNQTEENMRIIRGKLEQAMEKITGESSDIIHLGEIQKHLIDSVDFLLEQSELMKRNISMTECRLKHIPRLIVNRETLKNQLKTLAKGLEGQKTQDQYELAIPYQEAGKYYQHEIAMCLTTNDSLFIQVKVPIKKKDIIWEMYEIKVMPFVYNGSICHFEGIPAHVAISSDEQIRYITSSQHSECLVETHHLCYLEQYPVLYQIKEQCVRLLRYGAALTKILEECNFVCTKHSKPIITQTTSMEFTILNPTLHILHLEVSCLNVKPEKFKIPAIGSHILQLHCDCFAILTNPTGMEQIKVKIDPPYPCAKEDSKISSLTHSIPIYWLKEKHHFVTDSAQPYVSTHDFNLSSLIDDDLTHLHGINVKERLDTINTTLALNNLKVPVLFDMTLKEVSSYQGYWLGLLTLYVIMLTICIVRAMCLWAIPRINLQEQHQPPPLPQAPPPPIIDNRHLIERQLPGSNLGLGADRNLNTGSLHRHRQQQVRIDENRGHRDAARNLNDPNSSRQQSILTDQEMATLSRQRARSVQPFGEATRQSSRQSSDVETASQMPPTLPARNSRSDNSSRR
jgi:hypothetical protein